MRKKKFISLVLTIVMIIAILPAGLPVYAVSEPANYIFDISEGNITVAQGSGEGTLKVTYGGGQVTTSDFSNTQQITIIGLTTTKKVVVNGVTAKITVSGVNIQEATNGVCPFALTNGATVALTLTGTNILKSGPSSAGLRLGSTESLTIDGTGSLDVKGHDDSAGIGGIINGGRILTDITNGGTITINSGTVIATGGVNGAGIGGGCYGRAGNITINGGTVIATSGNFGASGIGEGAYCTIGSSGSIIINGGTVTSISTNGTGISANTITIGAASTLKTSGSSAAIHTASGTLEAGSTAAVLVCNYTNVQNAAINTQVFKKSPYLETISFAPTAGYKGIAFTVPSGNTYQLRTDNNLQQHSATPSTDFVISGAGLTTFNTVKAATQATPTFNPAAGAVAWGTSVTISSAGADAIYYTIDGSTPTTASTNQATTPLVINSAMTVKAIAVKADWINSAVASANYSQEVAITNFASTSNTATTAAFSWTAATGATGVKIQQSPSGASTWSDATTGAIANNAATAIVTGLTAGTSYDFKLVVTGGSNAGASNIVAVTTDAVAITNFASTSKTATTAAFSWTAAIGATGVKIEQSPTGANTWTNSTTGAIANNAASATVTGLTTGTTYDFRLVVTGGSNAGNSNTLTVTINAAPPVSGGTATPTSTVVEVNGKPQDAGTSSSATTGGQTTTTIKVDDTKLDKILEKSGDKPTVTLPGGTGSGSVVGELNGQTIKNMEKKEAVLEIRTEGVTYTLPASQINIDIVSSQLGTQIALKDIKVSVTIAEPSADTVKVVQDTANKGNYQLVVKPVDFAITCTSGDNTVGVSKFNCFIERTVAIPAGVDPSKITTGIVLNADGTFRHVPTQIVVIGGKYFAKINSLTNSTYSVIYNPVTFADVAKHWAKNAINDMGSRMVVTGVGSSTYEPDRSITRAEFAAVVVRALGLQKGSTESGFNDVTLTDWFNGYVDTATAYSLITGYDSASYGPNDTITREQAMTIIARAMKLTNLSVSLTDSETSALLAKYTDGASVSEYAKTSAAICLKSGVVTGSSETTLSPKAYVTRAEVAVMVQRLLQKSGLI